LSDRSFNNIISDLVVSNVQYPKDDDHTWSNFSSEPTKPVFIASTNSEYVNKDEVHIGVHGYGNSLNSYELTITYCDQPSTKSELSLESDNDINANAPGYIQCSNCENWIPERTIILHSNFCERNNIKCGLCGKIMKKGEEKKHWHCSKCDAVIENFVFLFMECNIYIITYFVLYFIDW